MSRVLKIGHRGAAGYEPENTLRSFRKAIALGADMIECDVRLCRSGEPVVFHDSRLNRTTNGHGLVSKKAIGELKTLDAGKKEQIPMLAEVIRAFHGKVKFNIELKGRQTAGPVAAILQIAFRKGQAKPDDFLISSYRRAELKTIRPLLPQIKIGLITGWILLPDSLSFAKKIQAYSIHLNRRTATESLLSKIRRQNFKAFAFTVNNPPDITRLKALGIDGIFSDYPDRI